MASLVIDRARELQDVSVAFFYFTHGDPERDRFVPMARAILTQLLAQDASLLLLLEQQMSISSGQAVLSSRELAKELLTTSLQSRKTYIILDGIDECERDHRKEVCGWFRSLADSLPAAKQDEMRCLFISQDDGFARKDLSMLPTLSMTADQNREDISAYAHHWQGRIEERFGPLGNRGLALADIVPVRSQGELKQSILATQLKLTAHSSTRQGCSSSRSASSQSCTSNRRGRSCSANGGLKAFQLNWKRCTSLTLPSSM